MTGALRVRQVTRGFSRASRKVRATRSDPAQLARRFSICVLFAASLLTLGGCATPSGLSNGCYLWSVGDDPAAPVAPANAATDSTAKTDAKTDAKSEDKQ